MVRIRTLSKRSGDAFKKKERRAVRPIGAVPSQMF